MLFFYSNQIKLQGIFLEYARRFLLDWVMVYAYIPLFIFFMAGLIALFMFQHLAYSSRGVSNSDFWNFANPGVLGVFNILEFIWAFQFLRDACKNDLIKLTSVSQVLLLIGIGVLFIPNAQPHSLDSSSNIGAAL